MYFFRDELPRVSAIQEGTTPLEDSAVGGVSLGRWVWNFRRRIPLPWSIIWPSLGPFAVLFHQGRNIEGFSLHLEHGTLQLERLASRSAWHWSSLLIQPLEASFVLTGAFCSSSYLLLVRPSEVHARSAIYCIDSALLIIKRSDLCLCFYILNVLWSACVGWILYALNNSIKHLHITNQ